MNVPIQALVTNLAKLPSNEVDFGDGGPVYIHVSTVFGSSFRLGPGPLDDGIVINVVVSEDLIERFKNSAVLREIVPGARDLFSEDSFRQLQEKLMAQK